MEKPYWNHQIQCLASEELAAFQKEKFQKIIKYLNSKSAFFRNKIREARLDIEGIKLRDLERIPFTTREELLSEQRLHPPFGRIPCISIEEGAVIGRSGVGFSTTGHRLNIIATHSDIWRQGEILSRVLWDGGVRASSHVFIADDPRYNLINIAFMRAACDISALTVYVAAERSQRNARYTTQALPPNHYFLTPTYSLYLGDMIHEEREEPLPIESVFGWGEPGFSIPGTREKIQDAWNGISSHDHVKLYEIYGSSEAGVLALSCAENMGMHCMEDMVLCEIIDPYSTKPLYPGEMGELVITHLHCGGMPLLRYRTGDMTSWIEDPCQCGRTHKRISGVHRSSEQIQVKQKVINANTVEDLLQHMTAKTANFRIVREDPAMGILKLFSTRDELPDDLENRLQSALGVPVKVELKSESELPRYIHRSFRIFEPDREAFYREVYAYQSQIE